MVRCFPRRKKNSKTSFSHYYCRFTYHRNKKQPIGVQRPKIKFQFEILLPKGGFDFDEAIGLVAEINRCRVGDVIGGGGATLRVLHGVGDVDDRRAFEPFQGDGRPSRTNQGLFSAYFNVRKVDDCRGVER